MSQRNVCYLGLMLSDTAVSQRNACEGAYSVGKARFPADWRCCITKNGFEGAESVDEALISCRLTLPLPLVRSASTESPRQ